MVIHVNSSFKLSGIFIVLRLCNDEVISVILSSIVFRYLFFISDVGNMEQNIVDVIIISNVFVVCFMELVNDVIGFCFAQLKLILFGFIIMYIIRLDRVFNVINMIDSLVLYILFKYVQMNINDGQLVNDSILVMLVQLDNIWALVGDPVIIESIYMGFICRYLFIMYGRLELISKLDNIRVGSNIGNILFIVSLRIVIV